MAQIRFASILINFFVFLFIIFSESAFGTQLGPQDSVHRLIDKIKMTHQVENITPQDVNANKKIFEEAIQYLDVVQISQKSLGKYWKKGSVADQKKFTSLLRGLFMHVAFPNSAKFFKKLKIEYGTSETKNGKAVVPLQVMHEEEGEIGIDFVLHEKNKRWLVLDVILDGVSMRNNLRSQFRRILKKKNFSDLLMQMEKKLNKSQKG